MSVPFAFFIINIRILYNFEKEWCTFEKIGTIPFPRFFWNFTNNGWQFKLWCSLVIFSRYRIVILRNVAIKIVIVLLYIT